jgi:hypothetical protein
MRSWLAVVAWLGLAGACTSSRDGGAKDAGWTVAETRGSGTPAAWSAESDPTHGRIVRCKSANSGQVYNLYLSKESFGPDLELTTRLRADTGEEDQGGGLVWRARDAQNYYVARWNPLEENLRLYRVVDGERKMLVSTAAEADASAWHDLRVTTKGPRIEVAFDGRTALSADDATFAEGGKVGLWTKADASTSFTLPKVR